VTLNKKGFLVLLGITALVIIISALALSLPYGSPLEVVVRLFALYGYLTLSVATMTTPFLKEIPKVFGKTFIKVHHIFAIVGTASATVHPVAYAIQTLDPTVFLPSLRSWYAFWALAGRPALIIIYIALAAALVRRKMQTYWRSIHAMMYVVLFLGIVHANLIGTDFQNPVINTLFNLLFAASIAAFALKRIQRHQLKKRLRSKTDRR